MIKHIIQQHRSNRGVLVAALSALGRIGSSEDAIDAMQNASLPSTIVDLLEKQGDSEQIVQLALMVLEGVAVVERHRSSLRELGVIDATMRARQQFLQNASIQQSSVALVGKLALS
jgi:hypothetical protein